MLAAIQNTFFILVISLAISIICVIPAQTQPADIKIAAKSTTWKYTWKPVSQETAPTVTVCPLKYDKMWAYAVEIDDGPISAFTVTQPLLEQYFYSDAPPGMHGGKAMPFVGGVGVMVIRVDAKNATFVNWEQLHTLQQKGWGIINHGYWHSGNSWDPNGGLTAEGFRNELFWSQAFLAVKMKGGRSASHFIYPNGYMEYKNYLKEFGLISGSRVAGKSHNLADPTLDLKDLDRNYLDESVWAKPGDVMAGFPAQPKPSDLIIDFTHGMDPDSTSPNNIRWHERLKNIAGLYGRTGKDNMWCASTPEIVEYSLAAHAVKVQPQKGEVTLSLPSTAPGSSITFKMKGINAKSEIMAPSGGAMYRKGDEVWITTPVIGVAEAAAPNPHIKRIYEGPVKDVTLEAPAHIAGIRVLQFGEMQADYKLNIGLVTPEGKTVPFVSTALKSDWGTWLLYPTVPNHPAPMVKGITINSAQGLLKMEIWAVE